MKTTYETILFAPDGESVRDYEGATVDAVWNLVNDGGSRWYFYPVAFVIRKGASDKTGRIVDTPEMLGHWKGRSLASFSKEMARVVSTLPDTATVEDVLFSL